MTPWLTFSLEAPMASFGEEPGNAARGTAALPTKSALVGLVGAALGILRQDAAGQEALAGGYRFVVRADDDGTLLRDFHTYQSLPSTKGAVATRAAALEHPDLVTSITRRDYRCGVTYRVAMRADADARWSLEEIADAMKRPAFALYLGRRSCPLGAPLTPRVKVAEAAPEALRAAFGPPERPVLHAAEQESDLGPTNADRQRRRRPDRPTDRMRWHFATRDEWLELRS